MDLVDQVYQRVLNLIYDFTGRPNTDLDCANGYTKLDDRRGIPNRFLENYRFCRILRLGPDAFPRPGPLSRNVRRWTQQIMRGI